MRQEALLAGSVHFLISCLMTVSFDSSGIFVASFSSIFFSPHLPRDCDIKMHWRLSLYPAFTLQMCIHNDPTKAQSVRAYTEHHGAPQS